MSDIERSVSLKGLIFGSNGETNIPQSPAIGTTYRNENYSKQEAANGWPFATVVDSADFNDLMYRITSVLDAIEVQGILFWSSATKYVEGSIVRRTVGSTEKFFEALATSGPGDDAKDPAIIGNIGNYWKEASIGGGSNGGYAVQFVSASTTVEKGILYFATAGNINLALPTIGLMNGDKLKVATGRAIGLGSTVNILGAIEAKNGSADTILTIDAPYSSVELIYNSSSGLWKVCSPITKGTYVTSSVPVGTVLAYAANLAPSGFFICDGSAISRTIYSQLFSVIGTTYGAGDGSTTFNLPDLRGKFLRGFGNSSSSTRMDGTTGLEGADNIGQGGFSEDFGVLQQEELPNLQGWLRMAQAGGIAGTASANPLFQTSSDGASAPRFENPGTDSLKAKFNAEKYCETYKDNGHVVPANYAMNFLIKY